MRMGGRKIGNSAQVPNITDYLVRENGCSFEEKITGLAYREVGIWADAFNWLIPNSI